MLNEQTFLDILKHNFEYVLDSIDKSMKNVDYNNLLNAPIKKEQIEYFTITKDDCEPLDWDAFVVQIPRSIGLSTDVIAHLDLNGKPLTTDWNGADVSNMYPENYELDGGTCLFLVYHGEIMGESFDLYIYDKARFDTLHWEEIYDPNYCSIVLSYYCNPDMIDTISLSGINIKKLANEFLEDHVQIQDSLTVNSETYNDVTIHDGKITAGQTELGNGSLSTNYINAYEVTVNKTPREDNDVITKKYLEANMSSTLTSEELLMIADDELLIWDLEFDNGLDVSSGYHLIDPSYGEIVRATLECTFEDGTIKLLEFNDDSTFTLTKPKLDNSDKKIVRLRLATSTPDKKMEIYSSISTKATKINHYWHNPNYLESAGQTSLVYQSQAPYIDFLHIDTNDADYVYKMFWFSQARVIDKMEVSAPSYEGMFCVQATETAYLQRINELNIDFSKQTSNSCRQMFMNCSKLEEINQPLDTRRINNMTEMFANCERLRRIKQLNVSNMVSSTNVFNSCIRLNYIGLVSNDYVTLGMFMFNLPERTDGGTYIIDISNNPQDIIDQTIYYHGGTNVRGWTIKTTRGDE
jgi:hypothetical protein